jgi:DnaJ-domain-containing protein 1
VLALLGLVILAIGLIVHLWPLLLILGVILLLAYRSSQGGRVNDQASGEQGPGSVGGITEDDWFVLGLCPGASLRQLKDAYRRLVKTHHPDAGGDPEVFKRIQEAYEKITAAR